MVGKKAKRTRRHGTVMTGADMIIQVIADEGIDTIFGYSGGAILPTYDAIFRYNSDNPNKNIKLVVPANEQGAGFMAAGYARSTGKVGVSIVTSGPGATNSATPIRDCMSDSIPMVLISGQVARASIGTDAFQEAPVFSLMSSCAKHVFLVKDPEEMASTIRTAFQIARSGRPGPVVIDVPKDVQNWEGPYDSENVLQLHGYQDRVKKMTHQKMPKKDADTFLKLLKHSRRPLLYVGGGAVIGNASKELHTFMKQFQIPAVTTLMGIGAIDTQSDLCLDMLGMHGSAYGNYAVDECDMLIALGARFDDRVAGLPKEFAANAVIAHIDIDAAEIGKVKPVDWHYVGDAAMVLRGLNKAGKDWKIEHKQWLRHVAAMKKKYAFNFNRESDVIQPQAVLETLNTLTKGDAIIVTGVGQHQMFSAQYFDFKHPRSWITSGSMGTMGFGLPAAVGAQAANPGKLVIDVDGDGSLRMNIGELETCTNYDLPVKVLLMNNQADGMVLQWQTLYYGSRFSGTDKTLHMKDFVKSAEADGFKFAQRVSNYEDLQPALEAFISFDGPAFLEVRVDKSAFVYPMVGPGLPYRDMITGPHIEGRDTESREDTLNSSSSF
ncbi:MAG: biosynthetic-type acetolactate synthase large subunit [Candidatus Hydrogenedentes bacterium]|nr:biosynthetic-type acetolactate synthase large subunit [Candidatus Hydrogenedentota bacterium]